MTGRTSTAPPPGHVGHLGSPLDGLVQIFGLYHVEPPQLLLHLRIGAVGGDGLIPLHSDGGGGGGRLKRFSGQQLPRFLQVVRVLVSGIQNGGHFFRRLTLHALFVNLNQ